MIVDLNITEYIRSLMKEEKNDLSHIESEARVNHVPIVKPETKELLRTLVLLKKPMKPDWAQRYDRHVLIGHL